MWTLWSCCDMSCDAPCAMWCTCDMSCDAPCAMWCTCDMSCDAPCAMWCTCDMSCDAPCAMWCSCDMSCDAPCAMWCSCDMLGDVLPHLPLYNVTRDFAVVPRAIYNDVILNTPNYQSVSNITCCQVFGMYGDILLQIWLLVRLNQGQCLF